MNDLRHGSDFIYYSRYWEGRLNKLNGIDNLYHKVENIRHKIDSYFEISPDVLRPIDRKIRSIKSEIVE